jgi:hypothetical protein
VFVDEQVTPLVRGAAAGDRRMGRGETVTLAVVTPGT